MVIQVLNSKLGITLRVSVTSATIVTAKRTIYTKILYLPLLTFFNLKYRNKQVSTDLLGAVGAGNAAALHSKFFGGKIG